MNSPTYEVILLKLVVAKPAALRKEVNNMSTKIFLHNYFLRDSYLSDEAIFAYVAIRLFMTTNDYLLFSLAQAEFALTASKEYMPNKKLKNKLLSGLKELESKHHLVIEKEIDKENFLLSIDDDLYLDTNDGRFTQIETNHIQKVMNLDTNVKKLKLLRYFLVVCSTLNGDSKCGWTSTEKLSTYCGISKPTILTFNSVLSGTLLCICKGRARIGKNGKIHNESNVYSLIEDTDKCLDFFQIRSTKKDDWERSLKEEREFLRDWNKSLLEMD